MLFYSSSKIRPFDYKIIFPAPQFNISPKNGTVKQLSSNSSIQLDDATKNTPRPDIATLEFQATSNTQYALDQYRDVYAKVTEFFLKYKLSDEDMIASAKFMVPGASDEIFVKIVDKKNLKPDKVHFVTDKGKEYQAIYDATKQGWTVTLLGSDANDGQNLYVVQEESSGKAATLARLNIYSYEQKSLKVKLVPVNGYTISGLTKAAVSQQLNAIYKKVGITCDVEIANSFTYEPLKTKAFNVTSSGLFSTLTDDMKAINSAYMQSADYQDGVITLFMIENVTGAEGVAGDMPRAKQFGYLFNGATTQTIAHEIGHGVFHLDHPFDRANAAKSFASGDLSGNVMEYPPYSGNQFVKLQWDAIHAPGLVIGVFETDEDAMFINYGKIKSFISDLSKYVALGGGEDMLSAIILNLYVSDIDFTYKNWSASDIAIILPAITATGIVVGTTTTATAVSTNVTTAPITLPVGYTINREVLTAFFKSTASIWQKHTPNKNIAKLMELSNMSFDKNMNSANIKAAENAANNLISANSDAKSVILGLLFEFKYGIGPEARNLDANSVLTKGIINWDLIDKGREYFYEIKSSVYVESLKSNDNGLLNKKPMAKKQNGGDDRIYDASFTPTELVSAGFDLVKQYIGGFYMEIFPDKQGKNMELVLYNDVNLKSLVLHYLQINELTGKEIFPEKYPRIEGQITPLGEVKQILRWNELIDNKRFEKYIDKK